MKYLIRARTTFLLFGNDKTLSDRLRLTDLDIGDIMSGRIAAYLKLFYG